MDKKEKKRLVVLRERLQKLQRILAGSRQQCDDPKEIEDVERQIRVTREEIELLTAK